LYIDHPKIPYGYILHFRVQQLTKARLPMQQLLLLMPESKQSTHKITNELVGIDVKEMAKSKDH
jgi:hypothetical protein